MRRHYTRFRSILFACLCSLVMTTMLLSVSHDDRNRLAMSSRASFGNNYNSISPSPEVLIEMGLFRNGEIGFGNKLMPLTQSEICQKNCNSSILISASGGFPTWGMRTLLNNTNRSKYKAFKQTLSSSEYDQLLELLTVFKNVGQEYNLLYFLYGGTLLGSFRHFGLVPWDDDIDVMVNSSDRQKLKTVLSRVRGYSLDAPTGRQWKFYKSPPGGDAPKSPSLNHNADIVKDIETDRTFIKSRQVTVPNAKVDNSFHTHYNSHPDRATDFMNVHLVVPSTNSMWPYIDIFFFDENSTHIWDDNPSYSATYCFDKNDVFPVTYMQFENSVYPVPRNTRTFLAKSYNVDLCVTSTYSHRFETQSRQRQVSLPCRRLFPYFPFVYRYCGRGYLYDQLVVDNIPLLNVLLKC